MATNEISVEYSTLLLSDTSNPFNTTVPVYSPTAPVINSNYQTELDSFLLGTSAAALAFSADPTYVTATGVAWGSDSATVTDGVYISWNLNSVSSLDDLQTAVTSGIENGSIHSISVYDSGNVILSAKFSLNSFSINSGDYKIELTGKLPAGLADIYTFITALGDADFYLGGANAPYYTPTNDLSQIATLLDDFALTGVSVSDGSNEYFSISRSSSGLTLTALDMVISISGTFANPSFGEDYKLLDALQKLTDFTGSEWDPVLQKEVTPLRLSDAERAEVISVLKSYNFDALSIVVEGTTWLNFSAGKDKIELNLLGNTLQLIGNIADFSIGDLVEIAGLIQESSIAGTDPLLQPEFVALLPSLTEFRLVNSDGETLFNAVGDMNFEDELIFNRTLLATPNGDKFTTADLQLSNPGDLAVDLKDGDDIATVSGIDAFWDLNLSASYDQHGARTILGTPTLSNEIDFAGGRGFDTLIFDNFDANYGWGGGENFGQVLSIDISAGKAITEEIANGTSFNLYDVNFVGFEEILIDHSEGILIQGSNSNELISLTHLPSNLQYVGGSGSDTLNLSQMATSAEYDWVNYSWLDIYSPLTKAEFLNEYQYLGAQNGFMILKSAEGNGLSLSGVENLVFSDGTFSVVELFASPIDNLVYTWNDQTLLSSNFVHPEGTITSAITENDTGRAISAADALAALKLAVGLNPNSTGDKVSPYQYIAADVNEDGRVSAADALSILKMAVNLEGAPDRSWHLVDDTLSLWDRTNDNSILSRDNVDWALVSSIRSSVENVNFTAVLSGDVNGSWDNSSATAFLDPTYLSDLIAGGVGSTEQWG